jgi:hypothetical protein
MVRSGSRSGRSAVPSDNPIDSLGAWLEDLGLERYGQVLAENGVDLDTLPLLSDSDLERLGVLLGHRRRLLEAISNWTGLLVFFWITVLHSATGLTSLTCSETRSQPRSEPSIARLNKARSGA